MQNLDKIAEELFNKIRGRFPSVTIGDEQGNVTNEPAQARYFDFDFVNEGRPVGKVSVSLNDKSVAVVYGQDLVSNEAEITKNNWYDFLKELRMFARKRALTFDTRDITKSNLNSRDYKFLAKNRTGEDNMNESKLYGTSRVSYQDIDDARIIIKHTESINPELAAGRAQKIGAIYIESADGERFKYPYRHLTGARAMARHVAEGGNAYDDFGKYVVSLSEELGKLRKFKTYMSRSSVMAESLAEYMDVVRERITTVKKTLESLQKQSYYKEAFETFETPVMEEVPSDVAENWIDQLTIRQFNEELKDVFPYIYKLVSEATKAKELTAEDLIDEAGKLKGGADDPCWKGYKMVGTKKKGGKEVPNCVPKEEMELESMFDKTMGQFGDNVQATDKIEEDILKLDPITNTLVGLAVGLGMTLYTIDYWFGGDTDLRKPIERGMEKAKKAGNAKLYHSLAAKYFEDIATHFKQRLEKLRKDPTSFYKKDSVKTGAKIGDMKKFAKEAEEYYVNQIKSAEEKSKIFTAKELSGEPISKEYWERESIQTEVEAGSKYKGIDDKNGERFVDWMSFHGYGLTDDWNTESEGYALIKIMDNFEKGKIDFKQAQDEIFKLFEQGHEVRASFIKNFAPNKLKNPPTEWDRNWFEGEIDPNKHPQTKDYGTGDEDEDEDEDEEYEGNAYAHAVRKAKMNGKKKGDKIQGPDGDEITLEKDQKAPLSEFILSYFDRETGQFPKGETAVLTMIEKDYGEQYINPAKQFIERLYQVVEQYREPEVSPEMERMRELAGLR